MKKTNYVANLYAVGDLRYEARALPVPGSDEVLVRVRACGVCGSDVGRVYKTGTYHFPTVIGHEFAGEVVEDPKGELVGARVAVFPLLPCFACESCRAHRYATCENYDYYGSRRDGGMSDYLAVKRWNLLPLPDGVSFAEGAMCEPASVARHAVMRLSPDAGDTLLISGAGPIGILAGKWATSLGVSRIYYLDIDEEKLAFAERMGFYRYTPDVTVDCAIEGTGFSSALATLLSAVKPHGRVLLMGNPAGEMTLSQKEYWHVLRKELTLVGTWNSSYAGREDDWRASLAAMAEGVIDVRPLISHTYPLARVGDALSLMKEKKESYHKVMLVTEDNDE